VTASDSASCAPADRPADGLPTPRRYWAILAIALAVTMAVLDGTIANVALPTIGRELETSPGASIWIINAYQLAITVALLPLASIGDKIGYRRVYMGGLAIFTLGSLACSLSGTLAQLIAARVFQGLGAAGIMSINTAMVRFIYPQRMLGRGIGVNALVIAGASVVGPTVASGILALGPWQWLFAVNVPLGLAAILLGAFALPRTKGSGGKFDVISAILNALAFGGVILGAETATREGLVAAAPFLVPGLAAAIMLVRRQLPQADPLLPIDLLRIPLFRLSIATSICSFLAQMLALVALPFFLQSELGRSAVRVGVLMTPWPLATCVAAPLSGRLSDKVPAGLLGGAGLALLAVGLALLAMLPHDASDLQIGCWMALCGLGFGFFQSPNNRALISSAPRDRSGAAGGMLSTARLVGQTAGAVGVAALFHASASHTIASPTTAAVGVAAAIAAVAAVVSLLRLRIATPQPAESPST
jgi:DHA2 family multidrug resistance protein-like MFS transporter